MREKLKKSQCVAKLVEIWVKSIPTLEPKQMEVMFNFFLNADISMEHLIAIGCDGINVEVGKCSGGIRMLE